MTAYAGQVNRADEPTHSNAQKAAGGVAMQGAAEPLEWHFSQVFGERSPGEEVQEGGLSCATASRERASQPAA